MSDEHYQLNGTDFTSGTVRKNIQKSLARGISSVHESLLSNTILELDSRMLEGVDMELLNEICNIRF